MADDVSRLRAALAGRYTLERELGRGGMATVWLAQDLKHERPVALKVLRPELAAALGPERFLREIHLTARLTHPHILPLHDSGVADGFLFYVMPYVEGESLRDRLDREKQLPLDDALQIAREVADALSYAHGHDVVHRDVKPENILLEAGHAVVADFGIARAVSAAGGEKLTETGIAVGTPAYMSPEQGAGSRELDGRSDLYSLGCVLYEMLAGRPPFVGPTVESVVHQHLAAEPPSITSLRPAVPTSVVAALSRALAKTPADRFNPVALFGEALLPRPSASASALPAPVGTAPARRSWRRIALRGGAAIAVVVGAVAVGHWVRRGPARPRYPRTAIAVLPFQNLSAEGPHSYFAGGLHDELLTQLAKVAALTVRGRTSVMGYAGTTKQIAQIADELTVGTIVEGSVQVLGERLRVNVQLIDAATDEHLWAERYDRTLDDAFAIQSEVAQRIVTAVGAALREGEARSITAAPTVSAEAYRLYLQAEDYRTRADRSRLSYETALRFYERALALDSTFALAHAAVADVHGALYWLRYDPQPERLARMREAAQAALRADPRLPQARWVIGMLFYTADRDYARALEEFTSAVEGLPGSAELWAWVGYARRRLGHWDETLAALERATVLDSRDAGLHRELGNTLRLLHRYSAAIDAWNRALVLAPDSRESQLKKAWTYVIWRGELDTLRGVLQGGAEEYGPSGSRYLWRARLALWERKLDTLAKMLGGPATRTLESQHSYEPGILYVGWAAAVRGDGAAASIAFSGALRHLDSALRELPDDWRLHATRGLALAGLGRRPEARREAEWLRGAEAYRDAYDQPFLREARAMILSQGGYEDEATSEIEELLAGPSWTSVPMLRLDPRWDPIRDDPRFQALLVKYANPQPIR